MALTITKKAPAAQKSGILLESFSNPKTTYHINTETKSCSCASFSSDKHCKHLDAVGIYKVKDVKYSKWPSFSQGMSAMIKAIRLRRVDDAIYWLTYINGIQGQQGARFRIARRLLISSAEDGMSIPVMEKVFHNFPHLCAADTHVIELAAEVHRICKIPNWWDASTGGHEYIHAYLVGYHRGGLYHESFDLSLQEKLSSLHTAVKNQDNVSATILFEALCAHKGFSNGGLCDELRSIATIQGNKQALALLNIHATLRGPLSGDGNFLGQALWWLLGNDFSVGAQIEKVMAGEVKDSLRTAAERWTHPEPIPEWCCDGVHCGGNDRRFAGTVTDMNALCNAFNKHGRADPSDTWERSFFSFEGLRIK